MHTSSMRHSLMLSCLTCLFAFFFCTAQSAADSSAPGHLEPCATGGSCSPGLACDKSVGNTGVCVFSYETPCGAGDPCGIGRKCMSTSNRLIEPGSSTTGFGVCMTSNSTVDNNPISEALCNAYGFVTGKIGRTIIVIVIFVTGITFYLGKVSWGSVTAILLGAGLCFGGPAIVAIIVGGKSC